MRSQNVMDAIWTRGKSLADGLRALIATHKLTNVIAVNGVPSWTLLGFSDGPNGSRQEAVKTLLMIELSAPGRAHRGLAQHLLRA